MKSIYFPHIPKIDQPASPVEEMKHTHTDLNDESGSSSDITLPLGLISPLKQNSNYKEVLAMFNIKNLSNKDIFIYLKNSLGLNPKPHVNLAFSYNKIHTLRVDEDSIAKIVANYFFYHKSIDFIAYKLSIERYKVAKVVSNYRKNWKSMMVHRKRHANKKRKITSEHIEYIKELTTKLKGTYYTSNDIKEHFQQHFPEIVSISKSTI
jgi:hypothetical protein